MELNELLPHLSAIVLQGARGVGKTSTAMRRAVSTVRVDDVAQRQILDADPQQITAMTKPVLLDEWQRLPALWDVVRREVDKGTAPSSYLLTGSSYPNEAPVHTGAGRITPIRMRPLSLAERGLGQATAISLADLFEAQKPVTVSGQSHLILSDYVQEILRTGLPGIRQLASRARRAQLDGYIDDLVHKEFAEQGRTVRRPASLLGWLRAYAAATSSTASYSAILNAATAGEDDKPAKTTTIAYRDILSQLWLLDELPAWLPYNVPLRSLARAPKHRLADPGLAARLLRVVEQQLLDASSVKPHPRSEHATLLGALFEHLVSMSVSVYAQAVEARVFHLRTRGGDHEIDLIVEKAGRVVAIEIKLARAASDSDVKHLRWLRSELGDRLADAVVVTTGPTAYRRPDGIAVVPAAMLGP